MLRVAAQIMLTFVGVVTDPEGRREGRGVIDEFVQPWSVAIVDTPTPPAGPRRIDLHQWGDLLRAAELLGRPILRLHGGEGGPEGRLFYVADGPQSYVFGFHSGTANVARSGGYAPPTSKVQDSVQVSSPAVTPKGTQPARKVVAPGGPHPPVIQPLPPSEVPAPAVPAWAETLLAGEPHDRREDTDLPSEMVVERRIREMIHELLVDFRRLPASSDRLELGTEHIQRAVDMLHLGRYGIAQIELNKAARLLKEEPQS
jgi:hypothetical protein